MEWSEFRGSYGVGYSQQGFIWNIDPLWLICSCLWIKAFLRILSRTAGRYTLTLSLFDHSSISPPHCHSDDVSTSYWSLISSSSLLHCVQGFGLLFSFLVILAYLYFIIQYHILTFELTLKWKIVFLLFAVYHIKAAWLLQA